MATTKTTRDYFREVFEPAGGWRDQAELDKALRAVSPTQLDVIGKLAETGSFLHYLHGGFWTYDGCGANAAGIPNWWVTSQTVQAMERKGLLVRDGFYVEAWKDHRSLPKPGVR
jgi:hypothetical protein